MYKFIVFVIILQTEIAGHEPRIRAVCDNGVQMIDNGELVQTSRAVTINSLLFACKIIVMYLINSTIQMQVKCTLRLNVCSVFCLRTLCC